MEKVFARRSFVLLHDDGRIHYPFTKFLTDRFFNPNTRDLVAQSLRVFYRFSKAHKIELAVRATEGRCLSYDETKKLGELCYRPMPEIETMGDRKIIFLTSSKAGRAPKELPGAVEANTAAKRMNHISLYLGFYREVFLEPNIRSAKAREHLKNEFDKICHQLRETIRGTKQNHHLGIRSLPTEKYLSIIEAVFARPEECFQTGFGKPSRTLLRDRAMVLLSCEGLRPGSLGNIAMSDFRPNSGHLAIIDNRAKRSVRITTNTPLLKMGDSTQVTNASETMITLWPFTITAIQNYIDIERSAVLMKRLANRSKGFLFLSDDGGPIKHRSTITEMFNKLGKRLAAQGLLDIGNDPYFPEQKIYDFYGYVLRHSAACFFLAEKCREIANKKGKERPREFKDVPDYVKEMMKLRFGWVMDSDMPELYAARALSDNANIVLMDFNQSLLDAAQAWKKAKGDSK
ncbi:MAG: hypothetical protein HYU74_07050 [Dechloromonas sp.]|nr:hypothetical protein [Dechloromonas sp.]